MRNRNLTKNKENTEMKNTIRRDINKFIGTIEFVK